MDEKINLLRKNICQKAFLNERKTEIVGDKDFGSSQARFVYFLLSVNSVVG